MFSHNCMNSVVIYFIWLKHKVNVILEHKQNIVCLEAKNQLKLVHFTTNFKMVPSNLNMADIRVYEESTVLR